MKKKSIHASPYKEIGESATARPRRVRKVIKMNLPSLKEGRRLQRKGRKIPPEFGTCSRSRKRLVNRKSDSKFDRRYLEIRQLYGKI